MQQCPSPAQNEVIYSKPQTYILDEINVLASAKHHAEIYPSFLAWEQIQVMLIKQRKRIYKREI